MSAGTLITGASSGIGRALALELARRGNPLALAARRTGELDALRGEITARHPSVRVAVRGLDVTDPDAVFRVLPEMASELGGLSVVVANAGIGLGERVGREAFEKSRRTVAVNLTGAMATVDAAVQYFLSHGGGQVVGISSVAAFRGLPRNAAYCASKAGLAAYLEAVRAETRGHGIQVTVLYPGFIDTPLNDMLARRPFLISAEKGAALMADQIERKARSAFVPAFPWWMVARLLRILPVAVVARM